MIRTSCNDDRRTAGRGSIRPFRLNQWFENEGQTQGLLVGGNGLEPLTLSV